MSPTKRFANKNILITGAGSGIGQACAIRFATEGANVICLDIHEDNVKNTVATLLESGNKASYVTADIAQEAQLEEALKPHQTLHSLIHCAGISGPLGGPLESDSIEFENTLKINVLGAFYLSKYALPALLPQKGNLVFIASLAGLTGGGPPTVGPLSAYTTSKHALIGLARSISYRHGVDGVRANIICPGSIETNMTQAVDAISPNYKQLVTEATPLQRWGYPNEVAAAAAFLASDEASFITSDILLVDGGYLNSQGKVYPHFTPS